MRHRHYHHEPSTVDEEASEPMMTNADADERVVVPAGDATVLTDLTDQGGRPPVGSNPIGAA